MNVKDKNGNDLFPSWENLLLASVERLTKKGKESEAKIVEGYLGKSPPQYLKAAEEAREGLGSDWFDFLKEAFDKDFNLVDEKSLIIPEAIWNLGSKLLITTNYERVLYWSCPDKNNIEEWNIEATYEQVQLIKNQAVKKPTIWYLHGRIDDVRNIILTPNGYQNLYPADNTAKIKYEAALTTLRSLLVSHTFLFIGFSLDDEYFVNQLRYVQNIFQKTLDNHFILIRESDKSKLSNLNIGIEPITFESFGDEMLKKLYEIREETNSAKDKEKTPEEPHKTASERYNPKNRVVHIPFNKKGDQVSGAKKI